MSSETPFQGENELGKWMNQTLHQGHPVVEISEDKIQETYRFAYDLYSQRYYQEANYFFRFLILARPEEAKYWKGFGACLQMQKEYEEALDCYFCAEKLSQKPLDPYFYIHKAYCCFALKKVKAGLKNLEVARLKAVETHDQRVLKHVALMHELWVK
jgi:type III secretion system low calcium response chaperone LcrH/SycD